MIEKMLLIQLQLQQKLYPNFDPANMSYEEKVELSKYYALCLHEEITEVMSELKFKNYHVYDKTYDDENVKVEIIDCLKFVLNMALLWGMSADDVKTVFNEKTALNLRRLNGK